MKYLLLGTFALFLAACNIYEIAGEKTEFSDEFQKNFPHIAPNTFEIRVNVSGTAFNQSFVNFNIHGGEFTGANSTWNVANYSIDITDIQSASGWGSYTITGSDVNKVNNNEISVTLPTPPGSPLGPTGTVKTFTFHFLTPGYNVFSGHALPVTSFTINYKQD